MVYFLEMVAFLTVSVAQTRDEHQVFYPLCCRCLCLTGKAYLFTLTVYHVALPLLCSCSAEGQKCTRKPDSSRKE